MLRVLSPEKILWARTQCSRPAILSGNADFDAYAAYVMYNQGYSSARTWQEALQLYFNIARVEV